MKKLAQLIIGTAPWIQPRARQILTQDGDLISYGLDLRIPPGLRMDTPHLLVGKQEIEIGMPEIRVAERQQRIASKLEPVSSLEELPLTIQLMWRGEKYPVYEAVTHGTREVFFSSRIVFLSLKTTISRHGPKGAERTGDSASVANSTTGD